jgi:hypothetical protein
LLGLSPRQRFGVDLCRYIVEVHGRVVLGRLGRQPKCGQVGAHRLWLSGVGPPLAPRLARPRDHRVEQYQQLDLDPLAHERRTEAGERLADEDHTGPIADGLHNRNDG